MHKNRLKKSFLTCTMSLLEANVNRLEASVRDQIMDLEAARTGEERSLTESLQRAAGIQTELRSQLDLLIEERNRIATKLNLKYHQSKPYDAVVVYLSNELKLLLEMNLLLESKRNELNEKMDDTRSSETDDSKRQANIELYQPAIERLWRIMPKETETFLTQGYETFILQRHDIRFFFHALAQFWSSPALIEHTGADRPWMPIPGFEFEPCDPTLFLVIQSWKLAQLYLKKGEVNKARVLTLSGSFLYECTNASIEDMLDCSGQDASVKDLLDIYGPGSDSHPKSSNVTRSDDFNYTRFYEGYIAVLAQQTMETYLSSSINKVLKNSTESAEQKHDEHRPVNKVSEQKHIRLVLVDGSTEDETFDIPASVSLKSFFNDYAEKRGVSLRSLRFSYNGATMFLSSVGRKSPEELNMQDRDVITVHDLRHSAPQEASSTSHQSGRGSHNKANTNKKTHKRNKCKSKKKRITSEAPVTTLEEYKGRHSMRLSKVHEEVQPRLKHIRTRLNALDLERQSPKQRRKIKRKKTVEGANLPLLPNVAVGGKAGRPYFLVRVGEENNLYHTTRLPLQHGPCHNLVLDLHGFTREEALVKLEESLKVWVTTAIQGSYPFVMPATIICGCGNQILSETVQKWIKSTKNICNAPKT